MNVDRWDVLLLLFVLAFFGAMRMLLWAWGRLDQILATERLGDDR